MRLLFAALALSLLSSPAMAAPIVDQEFIATPPFSASIGFADAIAAVRGQSFTVGLDGQLTGADVFLRQAGGVNPGTPQFTWSIESLVAGVPSGVSLLSGSGVVPDGAFGPEFFSLDFMGASATVSAGDQLAILLRGSSSLSTASWVGNSGAGATYAGGTAMTGTGAFPGEIPVDLAFRTFVDPMAPPTDGGGENPVPEPSAALAFGLGLSVVAARRRAR